MPPSYIVSGRCIVSAVGQESKMLELGCATKLADTMSTIVFDNCNSHCRPLS